MEVTSHISPKGESSSLRTQFIEAQILDCQLEGDEYGLGNLITSEYSANLDDQNVSLFLPSFPWAFEILLRALPEP